MTLTSSNALGGDGTARLSPYGTLVAPANLTIAGVTLDVRGALTGVSDITLNANGGLVLNAVTPLHTGPHLFNSIIVNNAGRLTLVPYDNGDANYDNDIIPELSVTTLTVASGGVVESDGLGYKGTGANGGGPGGGQGNSFMGYRRGAGGGYGGKGGDGYNDPGQLLGGSVYGQASAANNLGSAGGAGVVVSTAYIGASGGGAFHLRVTGVLTVDGRLSADGANGTGGRVVSSFGGSGGGSGGAIEIVARTLAGAGFIQVNGGSSQDSGNTYGSGGGGGRLVIVFDNFSFTGLFQARGGLGYNNGEDGTINGLRLPRSFTLSLTGNDWREAAITTCLPCVQQMTVGGPINTLTGNMEFSAVDLSLPTAAGPLTFQRSYSTGAIDLYTGALGYGWTHNLDMRLILPGMPGGVTGQVVFKAHSANQYLFYDNGDGTYSAYPGIKATLTRSGSAYTLTTSSQTVYNFDSQGKLTTWVDSANHAWTYTYTNDRLTQVESGARFIAIGYDGAGRIQAVSDHSGRSVSLGYDDANGDLTTVTDVRGKVWTYRYDPSTGSGQASHRLQEIIDPLGRTVERTEYDPQGRAVRQYNGKGELVVELTYNPDGTTTVTDGLGHSSLHDYDARGTLTEMTNALAGGTQKTFDNNFHPASFTDELNHTTDLAWSGNGANLEQVTNAEGHATDYGYDPLNNLTEVEDALGRKQVYRYTGIQVHR